MDANDFDNEGLLRSFQSLAMTVW